MGAIRSMTGYGRAESRSELGEFTVDAKSVNHRYLEARVHTPREVPWLEPELTRRLKERLARGKVDVTVRWRPGGAAAPRLRFNRDLLAEYAGEIRDLADALRLEGAASVEYLLGLPGVAENEQPDVDQEAFLAAAAATLGEALDQLVAEREREGAVLAEEIAGRLDALERASRAVEERSADVVEAYRDRLKKKVEEWVRKGVLDVDPNRLESEALLFADRSDVTEEAVRLRAHIEAFRGLLQEGGPVGKRMEFLTQELLREANTSASKSRDTEIAGEVLAMKNEIEKIREQALNVE